MKRADEKRSGVKNTRWLPATLFGRNVLLIAGLIVAVQIGVLAAFFFTVQRPRLDGVTQYAIQHAEAMRRALETMNGAEADQYIAAMNATGPMEVVRGNAPVESGETPRDLGLRLVVNTIGEKLPKGYELRWQHAPKQRIWFGTDVRGETIWLGLDSDVLLADLSSAIVAIISVAGLLAFGATYAIQHRINRPLRRLIDATGQIGAGQAPRRLEEQGARELGALARSFNAMVDSLSRAERDRALMLAGISHDLRTPLTKVRFGLEYVGPHCEPDMRALMERNIEAADRIIDQFIDFARYGDDEAVRPVDLDTLVVAVVGSFDPEREPIALELGELPTLLLRPTAMQRLVANLLRNAVEHARSEILVRTALTADGFCLSVLDRGPGIPQAEIERLKQPFTRMEAARGGPGGSGLGLAIVERVTRLHGGHFDLLPRESGGLEARVTLPLSARRP